MRHLENDHLRPNTAFKLKKRNSTSSLEPSPTSSIGSASTTELDPTHSGSSASSATVTITDSLSGSLSSDSSVSSMLAASTIEPSALTSTTEVGGAGLTVVVVISYAEPSTTALPSSSAILNLTSSPLPNSTTFSLLPNSTTSSLLFNSTSSSLPASTSSFLTSSSSALASAHADPLPGTSHLSPGAIAGTSVASVVAFFALLAVLFMLWRNKRKEQEEDDVLSMMVPAGGPDPYAASYSYSAGRLSQSRSIGDDGGGPGPMMAESRGRY
ncbi:hypothetical protein JCM1840_004485 [Sporobolomyces johnsonii]